MTAPDRQASKNTRAAVVLSLQALGIPTTDAERQRHVVAVWTKGRARRRSELTERDAGSLIARLRTMSREELAAVLARPAPEPEPTGCLATWCEDDACTGTHPAPEPEPLPPIGAFHLTPDGPVPVDVAALVTAEDEIQPWRAEDCHRGQHEDGGPYCVAHGASWPCDDPDAPRVEPPPADVEQAAEEAARRFRERQAAGIIPKPPDLLSIPPRVPVVLGPPPGRYCLAVCYCGGCEHWTPTPPVDYSKTPGSIAYEEANRWRR